MTNTHHTQGPWFTSPSSKYVRAGSVKGWNICAMSAPGVHGGDSPEEVEANARLISAAPELRISAGTLLCLATSPRFQNMSVKDALAELVENGACPIDFGAAAIAKTEENIFQEQAA